MSDDHLIKMTPQELDAMLEKVIERTLTRYGVDVKNPIEQQKDMNHLRSWRVASENSFVTVRNAFIVTLVTGFLGAVWLILTELPTKGS